MFKVGQKVWCEKHGEGVVDNEAYVDTYPIKVEFVSGECACYTEDGKLYKDDNKPRLSVIEGDVMFKVGQKVRCDMFGEGVVSEVGDENQAYPVVVKFIRDVWDCYTDDGRWFEDDDEPSLSVIEE